MSVTEHALQMPYSATISPSIGIEKKRKEKLDRKILEFDAYYGTSATHPYTVKGQICTDSA